MLDEGTVFSCCEICERSASQDEESRTESLAIHIPKNHQQAHKKKTEGRTRSANRQRPHIRGRPHHMPLILPQQWCRRTNSRHLLQRTKTPPQHLNIIHNHLRRRPYSRITMPTHLKKILESRRIKSHQRYNWTSVLPENHMSNNLIFHVVPRQVAHFQHFDTGDGICVDISLGREVAQPSHELWGLPA
jgi:hypothetical protein